jgi:phosphinothricin acetyltransferase
LSVSRSSGSQASHEAPRNHRSTDDVHRCYGGIAIPNPVSIALHDRFGFTQVAYFSEQGREFGRYWDVAWLEKAMRQD